MKFLLHWHLLYVFGIYVFGQSRKEKISVEMFCSKFRFLNKVLNLSLS